jgi:hypothetical protein
MVWHVRNEVVKHATLAEQRMSARIAGVELQQAVHAETFANGAQQCQQRGGEGADEQQAVTAHRLTDAGGREAHAKLQILGVTELWLDGPAPGVVIDQRGRHRLSLTCGQAPRFLHALGMYADDRADLLALRRNAGIAQLAGASSLAHPLGRGLGLPVGIVDVDGATEADDVIEAKCTKEGE